MNRYVHIEVEQEYVRGDRVEIGAAGSGNDVVLEMEFGPMWDGLHKKVVWRDANGDNPTYTILGPSMVDAERPNVYHVPIPYEPKAIPGEVSMAIKGRDIEWTADPPTAQEKRATLSVEAHFYVRESGWDPDAEAAQDVTPDQASQLQAEIEALAADVPVQIEAHNTDPAAHADIRKAIDEHIASTTNPHKVTAEQAGADPAGAADTALESAKKYTDDQIAAIPPPPEPDVNKAYVDKQDTANLTAAKRYAEDQAQAAGAAAVSAANAHSDDKDAVTLAAAKEYTDSKVVGAQSDWNEPDPASPAYIKNRICYDEPEGTAVEYAEKALLFEYDEWTEGMGSATDAYTGQPIVAGERYRVTANDKAYDFICEKDGSLGPANADPIAVNVTKSGKTIYFYSARVWSPGMTETIRVSVAHLTGGLKKIDQKFLPVPVAPPGAFAVCYDAAASPTSKPNTWYVPKDKPRPGGDVGMMVDVFWQRGHVGNLGYSVSLIWGEPGGVENETIVDSANISDGLTGEYSIPTEGTVRYQLIEQSGRLRWMYVSGKLIPKQFSTAAVAEEANKPVHGLEIAYLPGMDIFVQLDNGNTADVMRLVPDEGETLPVYGNGTGAKTGDVPAGYILHLANSGDHWQIVNQYSAGGGGVTPEQLNEAKHTTMNVELEDDGFGGYRSVLYNDADINNHRNAGGIVQAKYYNASKNQTYTYYYSTMESDRKPTFIRTYIEDGKVKQVLASVGHDKKVTLTRRTADTVTTQQLSDAIGALGTVFDYKGSKPSKAQLPSAGNKTGDVWFVEDESVGYIWLDSGKWEPFGPTIDLSGYLKKATNGTVGQFAVSDGKGGVNWIDIEKWDGGGSY